MAGGPSEKCHFRTHAPQTKTYSITSIGACEHRLRHGWPTTLHRLLAPGRCYSAWRRPNLQLRRQTDQRRRNGWHELAGHDRTMQLFMAFACLEGLARTIGIEEDADRIGRELPRGKLISTLSSPAILFANHAAPCRQALGGMLLHPLGDLRRAHQAGLHRDVSEVRGGDGLLVAICRRGETAEHGDDLYHDRRTPSLRWALAPLTL
jgi:hypothetical protein